MLLFIAGTAHGMPNVGRIGPFRFQQPHIIQRTEREKWDLQYGIVLRITIPTTSREINNELKSPTYCSNDFVLRGFYVDLIYIFKTQKKVKFPRL